MQQLFCSLIHKQNLYSSHFPWLVYKSCLFKISSLVQFKCSWIHWRVLHVSDMQALHTLLTTIILDQFIIYSRQRVVVWLNVMCNYYLTPKMFTGFILQYMSNFLQNYLSYSLQLSFYCVFWRPPATKKGKQWNSVCVVSLMPVGEPACLPTCLLNFLIDTTKNPYVFNACLCIN